MQSNPIFLRFHDVINFLRVLKIQYYISKMTKKIISTHLVFWKDQLLKYSTNIFSENWQFKLVRYPININVNILPDYFQEQTIEHISTIIRTYTGQICHWIGTVFFLDRVRLLNCGVCDAWERSRLGPHKALLPDTTSFYRDMLRSHRIAAIGLAQIVHKVQSTTLPGIAVCDEFLFLIRLNLEIFEKFSKIFSNIFVKIRKNLFIEIYRMYPISPVLGEKTEGSSVHRYTYYI